jgi:hypothetical protein
LGHLLCGHLISLQLPPPAAPGSKHSATADQPCRYCDQGARNERTNAAIIDGPRKVDARIQIKTIRSFPAGIGVWLRLGLRLGLGHWLRLRFGLRLWFGLRRIAPFTGHRTVLPQL